MKPITKVWFVSTLQSSRYKAKSLVTPTNIYFEVSHRVTWNQYPKYEVSPPKRPQDIQQNHWTAKCSSHWSIFNLRSTIGSHVINIPSMIFFSIQWSSKHKPKPVDNKMSVILTHIQSTLVISNSKGLSVILRDIRTSTYQICRI